MHILLYVLAAVAAAFLVFLLTAVITDYRPADREVLQDRSVISTANPPAASHDRQASEGSPDALPDSVIILCWNIGYGGLGDDMDFFYDGGTQVRTSRERTLANIDRKWTNAPEGHTASTRWKCCARLSRITISIWRTITNLFLFLFLSRLLWEKSPAVWC